MPQMLTDRQLDIMRIVVHVGKNGVSAMSRTLGMSHSATLDIVGPLVKSGLLEKQERTEVGRVSPIYLTKKGAEVLSRMEAMNIQIENCVLGSLTNAEKDKLLELLERTISNHPSNSQYVAAVTAKAAGTSR